ncbi:hypothetical protein MaudCBS49596_002681 [Microsporum audouinii]
MASINLNIGGGLVEIAALTALMGATTGESLILGSRGAAGLPWAAMSLFGTPFLIRACISARTPTWLREMIGVKNAKCDTMVGMSSRIERVARSDVTQKNIAGISAVLSNNLTKYGNIYMARFPSIVVSGSVLLHLAHGTDHIELGMTRRIRERELKRYGFRIFSLASGVSRYQILVRPRTPVCYREDTQDPSTVYQLIKTCELLFDKAQVALEVGLEQSDPSKPSTEVEIKAVKRYSPFQYCMDPRLPRYMNDGINIGWVFWIPLGAGQRLHLIGDLSFTGRQRMEVLSSEDVTKRLNVGNLYIGLRDVHDVQNVVEKSCTVGRLLINLLKEESDQS